jgi:hypothetical protein
MTDDIKGLVARVRGDIKPKKQLPPHITDGTEEDYCYVCGKLRWVYFNLTLHEDGIEHPFCAQLCWRCGTRPMKNLQPIIMRKYADDPQRFVPDFPCNDCGVNCLEIGDWYLAKSEIWEKALGLGWSDNLCIACLEKRLGRRLRRGLRDVHWASTRYRRHPPLSRRLWELWRPPKRRRALKRRKRQAHHNEGKEAIGCIRGEKKDQRP